MSRQDKKERNRLKRKHKQQELRRKRNASVFQTLAHTEGRVECYVNANWRETGEASINVFRPMPGGGNVVASFLVDLWCSGLKDVIGRMNVPRSDFEKHLKNPEFDFEIIPLDVNAAQRLIAGGMRLCVENGFRLPHKASRWASIVGVDGFANADLSDFEKPGGKYRYVGTINDLRKRLVGPVEEFLSREDVEYILEDMRPSGWSDQTEDDDDLDEPFVDGHEQSEDFEPPDAETIERLRKTLGGIRERAVKMIEEWLVGRGEVPHPLLSDAFALSLIVALAEKAKPDDSPLPPDFLLDLVGEDVDPDELNQAVKQIADFSNEGNGRSRLREMMEGDSTDATSESRHSPELRQTDALPH